MLDEHPLGLFRNPFEMCKPAYSFDCTFFRLICLTAKVLRRIVALDSCPLATYTPSMEITMHDFLVGATEPEKYTLKRVQLRILG